MLKASTSCCAAAGEISDTLDLPALFSYLQTLADASGQAVGHPGRVHGPRHSQLAAQLQDSQSGRLVIGACTPRTHEPLFQRLAAEAGINPYLMETVNLREQCAWVHAGDPAGARARRLKLRVATARVRLSEPIHSRSARRTAPPW